MSLSNIQRRLKSIEGKAFYQSKDKWKLKVINILHKGTDDDINNNKRYYLNYGNKELVYDDIQDFYKEYNIYPNKDINPIIIDIVDNKHLEQVLWDSKDY